MQQVQKMGQEELVALELNQLRNNLSSRIYNEFQYPLRQILLATELLADNNRKSTYLEQLQHLQIIRNNVKQMVESLENLMKDTEGDHIEKSLANLESL